MANFKRILAAVLGVLQFLILNPVAFAGQPGDLPSGGESRKFLVTAYYSPMPEQRFYILGDYHSDVRLNGRGTNGADGTEVYVGMLAAPKSYPFGTQVYIPGLGVGEVHDRGGAIIAGKNYDRIDIWMGRGEEGLARALNWGARLVDGYVNFNPGNTPATLDYSWVKNDLPEGFIKRLTRKTLLTPAVFNKPISKNSDSDRIQQLQEALTTFGYYNGPITGTYNDATTQAILSFQLAEGIVHNQKENGAGYLGPKTREVLFKKVSTYNAEAEKERSRLEENRMLLMAGLGKKATGDNVKALQQMLWELGYYHGPLNGLYDSQTIDAVFAFQEAHGLIQSNREAGAGYYGKKTHEALLTVLDQKMEKIAEYPKQMQTWVPEERELPLIASLSVPEQIMEKQAIYFALDLFALPPASAGFATVRFYSDLALNDQGQDVKNLQQLLAEKGYLAPGSVTGYYGEKTQKAVLQFQLENKILHSVEDQGAGCLGPKTRAILNQFK